LGGWSGWVALEEGGRAVNTHRLTAVADASLECSRGVACGHVPCTSHDIVNVLAVCRGQRTGFAGAEAELVETHKVSPFVNLLEWAKGRREDQASNGVSVAIRAVWIKLTTAISSRDVDFRKVPNPCYLDKVWRLHEMGASDGTIRNETSSVANLHAIGDGDALNGTDHRAWTRLRWPPHTKIVDRINVRILAARSLVEASSASIRPGLSGLALIGETTG